MALFDPRILAEASSSIGTTCHEIEALRGAISHAEVEIGWIVYGLFAMTTDEVALIEGPL